MSVTTSLVALVFIIVNGPFKLTAFKCLQRAKHGPTCSGGFALPTKHYLVGTTALNLRLMKIQHSHCKESNAEERSAGMERRRTPMAELTIPKENPANHEGDCVVVCRSVILLSHIVPHSFSRII